MKYTVQEKTLLIATNILQYFLPQIKIWLNNKRRLGSDREDSDEKGELYVRQKKRWENDKDLLPENPLSFDYIEMVIQESYRKIYRFYGSCNFICSDRIKVLQFHLIPPKFYSPFSFILKL